MKNSYLLVTIVLVSITIFSCKKNTAPQNKSLRIYVAGNDHYDGILRRAKYWKDGTAINLTDGTKDARAVTIFVSGNDVYAAGHVGTDAVYWKNGVQTNLTVGAQNAYVTAMAVSGNDVYCVGFDSPDYKIWKNDTGLKLQGSASAITISGTDIYLAGSQQDPITNKTVAKYWKNSLPVSLTDGVNDASATSIVVSGNDIYVAGYEYNNAGDRTTAKYWKNSMAVNLSGGTTKAYTTSMAVVQNSINMAGVVQNDIYVAGYESLGTLGTAFYEAKYWKNARSIHLANGTPQAYANSIFVLNDVVYVSGTLVHNADSSTAVYWIQGQQAVLNNGIKSAFAAGIFPIEQ